MTEAESLEKKLAAEICFLQHALVEVVWELLTATEPNLDAVAMRWRGIQQSAAKGYRYLVELRGGI